MLIKTFYILMTMLLPILSFGQENSLTIKNWRDDDTQNKNVRQRGNIYFEEANAKQNIANTPEGSSAAKCASKTVRIEWQPKWIYTGVGGVGIPHAAISTDQSLLALIETTKDSSGVFSSTVILLNVYNNRVVRVIDLPRRKANRLLFIPGMEKLTVACEVQKIIKQPSSMLLINCIEGEVSGINDSFHGEVVELAASRDGANIFALTRNPSELLMVKQDRWNNAAIKLKTDGKSISSIAVNKGNVLLAATKGEIRVHDAVTGQYFNRVNLPSSFEPDIMISSDTIDNIALLKLRGKAYALTGKRYKKIFDGVYGPGAYIGSNKTFVTLNRSENLIFFSLPDYEFDNKSVNAGRIRPKTLGTIKSIWSLKPLETKSKKRRRSSKQLARLLIIDSHGNIYYLYKVGRKWKKQQIIEAKK